MARPKGSKNKIKTKPGKVKGRAKKQEKEFHKPPQAMTQQRVRELARMTMSAKEKTTSIAGDLGSLVRDWKEKYGHDPQAFRLVMVFYQVGHRSGAKLDVLLTNFYHFMDCLGIEKMRQPGLPMDIKPSRKPRQVDEEQPTAERKAEEPEPKKPEPEPEANPVPGNVEQFEPRAAHG
jgi:hypothetical protein